MQITIIGAGAMGSLFGGLLHHAGNAVTLVDVRAEHIAALRRRDLVIEEAGGTKLSVRVPATTDAGSALSADLFILFVKTPFTATALRPFAGRVPAHAMILTMQNGIGNDEDIVRTLGKRVQVVLGVTAQGATALGPNTIRHRSSGPTIIGLPDGQRTPELEAIAEQFTEAGMATRTTRHIYEHVWQKLIVNVGINALTALTESARMATSSPTQNWRHWCAVSSAKHRRSCERRACLPRRVIHRLRSRRRGGDQGRSLVHAGGRQRRETHRGGRNQRGSRPSRRPAWRGCHRQPRRYRFDSSTHEVTNATFDPRPLPQW